jgi:hypothetical protein
MEIQSLIIANDHMKRPTTWPNHSLDLQRSTTEFKINEHVILKRQNLEKLTIGELFQKASFDHKLGDFVIRDAPALQELSILQNYSSVYQSSEERGIKVAQKMVLKPGE